MQYSLAIETCKAFLNVGTYQ